MEGGGGGGGGGGLTYFNPALALLHIVAILYAVCVNSLVDIVPGVLLYLAILRHRLYLAMLRHRLYLAILRHRLLTSL